ncbi:hypothetical protein [Phycicoccus avicenniae]|uniref:hypothetical protein n=1 Tax=Phycicoccus avicenniae TaxID=2828860 RepID=UPI003D28DA65
MARGGLVTETREPEGRRRRLLAVTDAGRDALAGWLTTRATEPTRIHDDALLRLYFARPGPGDPTVLTLAADQERAHQERLALYDGLVASGRLPEGSPQRATLELGRRFEEAAVRFWAEVPAAVGAALPGEPA